MTEETVVQRKAGSGKPTLPSDMKQVGVVAKYDVLKHLRSRRLLGMIAIEALVLLLITALPPLLGHAYPNNADEFVNRYASFANILVVIGATLFAGDAIVSEFQSRTGYLLFPNPVKRWTLLAGKFIASMGAMFLVVISYYVVVLLLGLGITGGFSTLGAESLGLAVLYSVAALALGYFISAFMKGATGALIFTFALLFLILEIVSATLSFGGVKPWFILTFAGQTIADITTVPYPVDTTTNIGSGTQAMTFNTYVPDVGVSIAVMVVYAVVSLLLAYVFFKRREMSS